jgi:hypothetical protein
MKLRKVRRFFRISADTFLGQIEFNFSEISDVTRMQVLLCGGGSTWKRQSQNSKDILILICYYSFEMIKWIWKVDF